jgi:hypothetical protein
MTEQDRASDLDLDDTEGHGHWRSVRNRVWRGSSWRVPGFGDVAWLLSRRGAGLCAG